jgi:RNA polymerase sigma-70 factor (ECF subfamily)
LQDWLGRALEHLSPEQRAVMELTCVQGLGYEEIATILGCPENTVKTRMFHARKKLKSVFPDVAERRELEECFSTA